eukprot:TRINITY_DN7449_c1_g2_i1.p1 TRINITY_DN7449_c1_g2~~TRINITY_DN7449_c1_g2_i1.p1  ORF type:complete len:318 (-),score=57.73 TRINITY_DN7449_c1_g2_i1:82-972(-)
MAYSRRKTAKSGVAWHWWAMGVAGFVMLCMAIVTVRLSWAANSQAFARETIWPQGGTASLRGDRSNGAEARTIEMPVMRLAGDIRQTAAKLPSQASQSTSLGGQSQEQGLATQRSATTQPQAAQAVKEPEVKELSVGRPATSDVRGNLGAAKLVTQARPGKDWLKDRWQAAKDMSGSPIPGEHWLSIDLGRSGAELEKIILDFEVAHANKYVLETAEKSNGPWTVITKVAPGSSDRTVDFAEKHVIHTISRPVGTKWHAQRYVRARFTERSSQWGVSVWRFRIFGVEAPAVAVDLR